LLYPARVHREYHALLEEVRNFFEPHPDKPEETPETVLKSLWMRAAGRPASVPAINGHAIPALDAAQLDELRRLVARKREGAPLAHLTGRQSFMGLELIAGPQALIPRRETEILGRAALSFLAGFPDAELLVVDVCTGSGNLALALAHHEPRARVVAADISPDAVALARRNAEFTGLAGRVEFHVGDLFAPLERLGLEGKAALVCCNPPYITSGKVPKLDAEISAHEPALAFDGGALGLSILSRLFDEGPELLRPGGALCVEIGLGQGPVLESRLRRRPWAARVEAHRDASGAIRALQAVRR
jgi:release factor glutamine methyltransferase